MTINDVVIKQRNRLRTIQTLFNAVEYLFAEIGVDKCGIKKVASQASFNKVLIYRYFGSWNSLVLAYHQRFWDRVLNQPESKQGNISCLNVIYQVFGLNRGILALYQWKQFNHQTELARQINGQIDRAIDQVFRDQHFSRRVNHIFVHLMVRK